MNSKKCGPMNENKITKQQTKQTKDRCKENDERTESEFKKSICMWAFIRSNAADLSDLAIQLSQHIFMASVSGR